MEEQNQNELNLVELFYYLLKKIWVILIAAVVCGLVGFTTTKLFKTPMYTASTRMYVLGGTSSNGGVGVSDFQISTFLLKDYQVLITGRNVTGEVVRRLGLDISPEDLASRIQVTAPQDTRILQINVTYEDALQAADIANCVRNIASEQIKEIMAVDAVKTVYEAQAPSQPSSPHVLKSTLLWAVIGLLLSTGVYVVIFLMDDTIRTEEDVAHYLELSTLGVIPVSEQLSNGGSSGKRAAGHRIQFIQKAKEAPKWTKLR